MDMIPLFCIVSLAIAGLTKGVGVLPDGPLIEAEGGSVNFTTTLTPPETPFISVFWIFNGTNIFSSTAPNLTPSQYKDRITFFESTGSLELRSLALNDSGEYRVSIVPVGELPKEGSTRLEVHERVSNVIATVSSTDLVEFNSSVRLSCSASGSSLSFLWINGSSEVTVSDRVQLTDGGSNLTIINVTRYDEGPYRCRVSNPVSSDVSNEIKLSISYGPENISLIISPSQEYFEEGSNINISCSAVSKPSATFNWFLNESQLPDTGSELRLVNIQFSQSGNYSCQAFNQKTLRYETSQPSAITVLVRVANVVVTSDPTDLVEFNSTVRLSCSASGSFPSFLWLNSSSEVTASDRVQLTDGGSNLTIINVTRYDGPFMCRVSNLVSNDTSDEIKLSINYGPENINLIISPSQEYFGEGSNISISCSADSRPSALFHWFLNESQLSDTGSEIRLVNIQFSQSGNYSCQAFNQKTLRYETSQPSVVSVLERISDASVTSSTNQTIEGNPVNLTCEAAGSVFTRTWKKDGKELIPGDNIILHDKSRVLSFNSLSKTDSGDYSCEISNPINSEEAKYKMEVIYGPENVKITGPNEIEVKQTLTLTCSAESTPAARYTWTLNGTEIPGSSVYTKDNTEFSDSGNYICQAINEITMKTSSAEHPLSVIEKTKPKGLGCPAGCIAGIVIGCLLVVAAVVTVYLLYRKKKLPKSFFNRNNGNKRSEVPENTAHSGNEELNYAAIRFTRNKDGGTVQMGVENDTSEYAQVRVNNENNNNGTAAFSPPTYDDHLQRMKRQAPQPGAHGAQVYAQIRKS